MDQNLDSTLKLSADGNVVLAAGDINLHSAPKLREALNSAVGGANVILDLKDVGFVDSTGLGVIVGSLKRIRSVGFELVIRNPNVEVRRVLAITGLDQVLEIDPPT